VYPERLEIDPTKRTPWIVLEAGKIIIMGRSIVDNPLIYYEPGLKWLADYAKIWTGKTKVYMGFEYINTGSIKWLYILLRKFSEIPEMADRVSITWYYEHGDDDMCELGFIMRSLVDCPFTFMEVNEMSNHLYSDMLLQNGGNLQ
jgi:hypothetical protein